MYMLCTSGSRRHQRIQTRHVRRAMLYAGCFRDQGGGEGGGARRLSQRRPCSPLRVLGCSQGRSSAAATAAALKAQPMIESHASSPAC